MASWMFEILLGTILVAGLNSGPASDLFEVDVKQLADIWEREHISPPDPYSIRHAELKQHLTRAQSAYPSLIRVEVAGHSVEGREIFLVTMGQGRERLMLWSQMHGDEPTATSALLDLLHFFGRHLQDPWVAGILNKYTLLIIPMLNPDGAERMQRRNAQGIDINRDARALQTAEGQLLKNIRDRYRPFLGFNLHNQNATTTVGDTGRVATIALLAVASDPPPGAAGAPAPARSGVLAKQATAVLYEALSPFVYGHISRYDEEFNPRAFGDNLTLWGTPIVLMESGGNPAGEPPNFGVRLNFVGLLAVFNSLACGKIQNANPAVFDALKQNSDNPIYDIMLQNGWIFTGTGVPPFRGDVAVRADARAGARGTAIIADIGDLGVFTAHRTIDCSTTLITPGLIAWDPRKSLFADGAPDSAYLERGVLTLLATAQWQDLAKNRPASREWMTRPRPVNWGFLLAGSPARSSDRDQLLLAEWLSAGARAWISESFLGMEAVPRWFGIGSIESGEALKYQIPASWEGEICKVLPRFASEAAEKFALPRRGLIAQGTVADLVIWSVPGEAAPVDLSACKPRLVMINGQLIDLAQPDRPSYGRFIGR